VSDYEVVVIGRCASGSDLMRVFSIKLICASF
jgi:hypothetical protein